MTRGWRVAGVVTALRAFSAAGFAITLGIAARVLGPADLVNVLAALGVAQLFGVVMDVGVTPATARAAASSQPDPEKIARLLRLFVVTQVIGVVLSAATLTLMFGDAVLGIFLTLVVTGDRTVELANLLDLSHLARLQSFAATLLARRFITVGVLTPFVMLPNSMATSAEVSGAMALGSIAAAGLGWRRIAQRYDFPVRGRLPLRASMIEVRSSFPFWLNSVGFFVRGLDVYMVSFLAPGNAASFGVVSRMTSPLLMVSSSIAQVLMPRVARARDSSGRALRGLLLASALLAVPLALFAALGRHALTIVFGPEFADAWPILAVFLVGIWCASVAQNYGAIEIARNNVKRVALASIVGGVTSLICVALLASVGDGIGAAAGLAFGHAVNLVWLLVAGRSGRRQ